MTLLAMMVLSQVSVQVNVPVPTLRFEAAPALVEVEPGVQVVPEHEEEVFFHDGWYWHRREGHWWRSHDHQGHWEHVEMRVVPPALVRIPVGRYRHWKREERREVREEVRHEE